MVDALLLPSAILVPDELRLDLGQIPTGMIPLHGRPTLRHIAESYHNVDIYIACNQRADLIKEYTRRESLEWSIIELSGTDSLGETVSKAIDTILEERVFETDECLYLNFADTIVVPNEPPGSSNFVSYAVRRNPIRWTCFRGTTRIESVIPKMDPVATANYNVFTGLFRFSDPEGYKEALASTDMNEQLTIGSFYNSLLTYLSSREYDLIEADDWIDVGHLDTYHQAKKEFLNVRDFNSISTDDQRNRITKSSSRAATLRSEYDWYLSLPDELTAFAPKVYEYSEDGPSLTLEYVGYPSLRDLHLHSSHGLHIWNRIFDALFSMLDTFSTFRTVENIEESLKNIYIQKTKSRLSNIHSDELLQLFNRSSLIINDREVSGLPEITKRLESSLTDFGLFNLTEFTVIHGDLCFSNVLFDPRNGITKLIDPRGEFGSHVIYGDQRYDLAKLRHSVAGSYELIINDLFQVNTDSSAGTVSYNVFNSDVHKDREQLFDNLLRRKYPEWYQDVRLIESLLFLSMVPLHEDSTERQKYMLSRGIELFNEVVDL